MITRETVKQHLWMSCSIARYPNKENYHKALDSWLEFYPEDKEKIERLKDSSVLKEWYKAFDIEDDEWTKEDKV